MSDQNRNALVIGVTGGIACGKSEIGRIFGDMDFAVCDADCVAHDLMRRGAPVFQKVVERFGDHILAADGEISRPILGKAVFEDAVLREALNTLVHPAVREVLEGWIREMRAGRKNGVVIVPLLFESGMDDLDLDAVLCVSSSEDHVFQRLEKRGLEHGDAGLRIRSQMDLQEKERRADLVVPNNGTLDELEQAVRKTVQALIG
jgi:dephospho-CoA kinase